MQDLNSFLSLLNWPRVVGKIYILFKFSFTSFQSYKKKKDNCQQHHILLLSTELSDVILELLVLGRWTILSSGEAQASIFFPQILWSVTIYIGHPGSSAFSIKLVVFVQRSLDCDPLWFCPELWRKKTKTECGRANWNPGRPACWINMILAELRWSGHVWHRGVMDDHHKRRQL